MGAVTYTDICLLTAKHATEGQLVQAVFKDTDALDVESILHLARRKDLGEEYVENLAQRVINLLNVDGLGSDARRDLLSLCVHSTYAALQKVAVLHGTSYNGAAVLSASVSDEVYTLALHTLVSQLVASTTTDTTLLVALHNSWSKSLQTNSAQPRAVLSFPFMQQLLKSGISLDSPWAFVIRHILLANAESHSSQVEELLEQYVPDFAYASCVHTKHTPKALGRMLYIVIKEIRTGKEGPIVGHEFLYNSAKKLSPQHLQLIKEEITQNIDTVRKLRRGVWLMELARDTQKENTINWAELSVSDIEKALREHQKFPSNASAILARSDIPAGLASQVAHKVDHHCPFFDARPQDWVFMGLQLTRGPGWVRHLAFETQAEKEIVLKACDFALSTANDPERLIGSIAQHLSSGLQEILISNRPWIELEQWAPHSPVAVELVGKVASLIANTATRPSIVAAANIHPPITVQEIFAITSAVAT